MLRCNCFLALLFFLESCVGSVNLLFRLWMSKRNPSPFFSLFSSPSSSSSHTREPASPFNGSSKSTECLFPSFFSFPSYAEEVGVIFPPIIDPFSNRKVSGRSSGPASFFSSFKGEEREGFPFFFLFLSLKDIEDHGSVVFLSCG